MWTERYLLQGLLGLDEATRAEGLRMVAEQHYANVRQTNEEEAPVCCFKMTDASEESCCLSKRKAIIFYLSKFCLSWEFGEQQGGGRGGWG